MDPEVRLGTGAEIELLQVTSREIHDLDAEAACAVCSTRSRRPKHGRAS